MRKLGFWVAVMFAIALSWLCWEAYGLTNNRPTSETLVALYNALEYYHEEYGEYPSCLEPDSLDLKSRVGIPYLKYVPEFRGITNWEYKPFFLNGRVVDYLIVFEDEKFRWQCDPEIGPFSWPKGGK
jgi:hypothetical protein